MRAILAFAVAIGFAGTAFAASDKPTPGQERRCRPPLALATGRSEGDRAGAEPRAMLLLAVDRRVNGCRVLTPANARNDFLPEPSGEGPARRQPARGG